MKVSYEELKAAILLIYKGQQSEFVVSDKEFQEIKAAFETLYKFAGIIKDPISIDPNNEEKN